MAPELKLGEDLRLRLMMTPQLQQAIKILQLSLPELEAAVQTELESNPLQEEVTAIARKVEDGMAAAKPKPKYERNNEPQPGVVPCINADCDNLVSMSTGTGVKVTYPEGGPKPYDGWLCTECANLLL
jgi:DNA-directed RNA polymerase specialized sigma54-like protein